MKKVDIVYPYWITSLTGPSKNLIRFRNSDEFFKQRKVLLSFYTMDSIITKDFTHSVKKKLTIKSLAVKYINILSKYSAFASWQLIKRSFKSSKLILKKYMSENSQPDVIDFQDLFTCYFYLKDYPKSKAKIILFNHTNGEDFKMYKLYYPKLANSNYYKKLIEIQDFVLSKIDKYVFISDIARKKFLEIHMDFPESKTYFFHNGVPNLESNKLARMKQIITEREYSKYDLICTGTVNRRKGQELIIKALSQIDIKKRKKIRITFLGGGDELENFRQMANRLGLNNHIIFTGGVDNVDEYLAKANIFILASKDEGLPLSIIEAMRLNLPIIGSKVAGIPEMIEGDINGVLIEPTVDSIKNILNRLDDFNWEEMGVNSNQTYISKFTLDKMMSNYCKLINNI